VFVRDDAAVDIAVVEQVHGPTAPCAWLQVGDDPQGARCCWLRGAPRGPLATPAGWTPAHRLTLVTRQEQAARLTFVESREGVDVWRDDATGRLMYTGRVGATDAQNHLTGRLRALGRKAQRLEERLEQARENADAAVAWQLQTAAIRLGEQAEQLMRQAAHDEALAWHVAGVAYRVAAQWERAEQAFRRLLALEPDHHSGHLELVWCLAEQGKHAEALRYAREAVRLEPDSPGALGNLALSLIHSGQTEEARETIWRAVAADPTDAKNRYILEHFEEFVARARTTPDCGTG
jgi:tetratricopeptide (TPR) repeat protein